RFPVACRSPEPARVHAAERVAAVEAAHPEVAAKAGTEAAAVSREHRGRARSGMEVAARRQALRDREPEMNAARPGRRERARLGIAGQPGSGAQAKSDRASIFTVTPP